MYMYFFYNTILKHTCFIQCFVSVLYKISGIGVQSLIIVQKKNKKLRIITVIFESILIERELKRN